MRLRRRPSARSNRPTSFLRRRKRTNRTLRRIQRQDESEAEEAAQPEITYPLDLNRATLEELMTLPRIGEKLAQRILDYRAQYGRFSAPEQLMDVEGIGEGTFEGLRELVTVEDSK